jgi:hypothetical protein
MPGGKSIRYHEVEERRKAERPARSGKERIDRMEEAYGWVADAEPRKVLLA